MSTIRAAPNFVALDFETATSDPDSACAIGVAVVERGLLTQSFARVIHPPTDDLNPFNFRAHGIHPTDWANEPEFPGVWEAIAPLADRAEFLVAHNAGFDQGVLSSCCTSYGVEPPRKDFVCTIEAAASLWTLDSYALPRVCRFLGIPLVHHRAKSDAEASAKILLRALADGFDPQAAGDLSKDGADHHFLFHLADGFDPQATGDGGSAARLTKHLSSEVLRFVSRMMDDGIIDAREVEAAARWLEANADAGKVWPGVALKRLLDNILSDGKVEETEVDELRSLCAALIGLEERKKTRRASRKPPGTLSVCFTGFGPRKSELRIEAEAAGFHVTSGVTKTLDFLVTGPEPGPSKVALAQEQGTKVITFKDWRDKFARAPESSREQAEP